MDAARLAGCEDVPVIRVGHLSRPEQDVLMLALVRITERGEWDKAKLTAVFADLDLVADALDLDLTMTGFDLPEIDADLAGGDEPDEQAPPQIEGEAVTQPGDVWILGDHRVVCGDATRPETFEALLGTRPSRCCGGGLSVQQGRRRG